MKKIKLLFMLLLSCMLIIGCADSRILERISIVTLIGHDLADDNVTVTSVIREINPEFESKVEIQTETAETSRGTRTAVDMRTAKKIAAGQMRVVLFGEEQAKTGIEQTIYTLMTNNEVSTVVYLGVVKGTANALLDYEYPEINDIGQHIYDVMDHNVKQQQSISSTSHEVSRDYYSEVRNFGLPILRRAGENIQIDGVAFFSHGKMVGELPIADIPYIMMLRNNFKKGTLELKLNGNSLGSAKTVDEQLQIALDSINTKRSIKVVNAENNEFNLNIQMKCRLSENDSSISSGDPRMLKKIEKAINKKIESEISRILKYSQGVNSDIYGFGEEYRSQVRDVNLTEEKWSERYKKMKVNTKVQVEIIRNGVFE